MLSSKQSDNMGASCSSTALKRYSDIKNRLNQKTCLTFDAADGLLPRLGTQAPPVWLFGEDHGDNESDSIRGNGRNCALVTDLVQHAVSSCEAENSAEVIVVFENGVIADNPMFYKRDVNDDAIEGDPHHDVRFIRQVVKEHGSRYENIRTVYMDVFGRIRLFHHGRPESIRKVGEPQNFTFPRMTSLITAELKEFWVTCGKYDAYDAETMSQNLMQQSLPVASQLMATRFRMNRYIDQYNIFQTSIAFVCAIFVKTLISSRITPALDLSLARSYRKVVDDLDEKIENVLRATFVLPGMVQRMVDSGQLGVEQGRRMVFDSVVFDMIGVAGDAVLHDFITSLSGSDKIVVMHAGFQHTNNQRRWLLRGKYDSDFERVADVAEGRDDFVSTRG